MKYAPSYLYLKNIKMGALRIQIFLINFAENRKDDQEL